MTAVKVKRIMKSFGKKVLFQNLSFQIQKGEMVAIMGSSGSGKTTLLNCLGGLDKIDSGNIMIFDKEITPRNRNYHLREVFGFLFQNYALIDNETVYQNLKIVSNDKEKMRSTLINLGLDENCLNQKVLALSGGEQQRVALARLFLKKSQIILADEPTASLDAENRSMVMETLKALQDLGKTIVVVTHDEGIIDYFDRVIKLSTR